MIKLKGKRNGFLILLVAEAIFILILLPGVFGKEELVDSFSGEDILELTTPEAGGAFFFGNQLALTPGIYQVRVWSRLQEGEHIYVSMDCEDSYYKSLRNNGMAISPDDDYEDFEVYVLDKVPSAFVKCSFFGVGTDGLTRLDVWKTNKGNRLLLLGALLCFLVLDFLAVFRRRILEGKVTGKQQVVFWTLTAGTFLASLPYLTDYFTSGADTYYHVERIAFLAEAIKDGSSLPVRMQGAWLYGHGYATSLFYGDLFLYIPAFLCVAGVPIGDAYRIFIFLATAATAAIAYFSFHKCVKDEYAALFGSMSHLLAAYRIFNVYNRGAMGEYLAVAFLPLVCCGMYLLYTAEPSSAEYKKYKWYVVWGMSALLQSHLITTEITAVLMALVCVAFWKKTLRKQTLCQLAAATGIVLLINMWFWLPMLYMLGQDTYVLQELITGSVRERGITFANLCQILPNKGAGSGGVHLNEPRQIGIGAAALLLFYGLGLYWKKDGGKEKACNVLAFFSLLTLYMSTKYFPWEAIGKIPGIGFVVGAMQFPACFLGISCTLSAMFAALFVRRIREGGSANAKAVAGVAAFLTLVSGAYHVGSVANESDPVWLYNVENMGTTSVINGEWLLTGMDVSLMSYHKPEAEEGLIWSEYEKKGTRVSIFLENRTDETRCIEIPLTGYKGYGVRALGGESGELPAVSKVRGAHGDLRLTVPEGYRGSIQISYEGFWLFHGAEIISLLALAVIAVMGFCRYKHA